MTVTMTPDRFEELVGEALDLIPPELVKAIDNVVVLVEARDEEEPGLLGLYQSLLAQHKEAEAYKKRYIEAFAEADQMPPASAY